MAIEFREHHTLGYPFELEVRKSGVLIGHIRQRPGGPYRYYRGQFNELTPEFHDEDLNRLKARIEGKEGQP